MKKKFSLYIILIPILAVLISITLITIHNIKELNKTAKEDIREFTNSYLIEQKTKIYNRVHFFSNIIKTRTEEFSKEQKEVLKNNVEKIEYFSEHLFSYNKYALEDLKNRVKISFLDDNYVNIIIDFKNNSSYIDGKNFFFNKDLKNIIDTNGIQILNEKREFNKYININVGDKNYLFYAKKTKKSHLLILSGEDSEKLKEKVKQKVLNSIHYLNNKNNYYVFIIELFNKSGTDNYGKVLYHQANPSLNGKYLKVTDTNKSMQKYREDYLKIIREKGEGFVAYDYTKPNSQVVSKKLSFFNLQKDWNWIIGTGFYFDDLDSKTDEFKQSIENKIKESVKTALFVGTALIIFMSVALFLITSKINSVINNYASSLKESNDNLRKQKDIFETLFNKSTDGIIIYSEDGLIVNCNDSIVKMLGYGDKSIILNKSLKDFSPKSQYDNEPTIFKENLFKEMSFNNQTYSFKWLFISKNNKKLYCEIITTRLNLDGKNIIHALIRDITYKKELEETTKKQQVMLAEESKKSALGEMLTMIAHQWRQPLNNINLLIHFVRDTFDSGKFSKDELKQITLDMKTQIDYLSNTINDFTNFTNPQKESKQFCVKDAINKTYNLAIAQFEKNNIKVFIESEEIKVYGVENEFMQVILNILNNAKDALLDIENNRLLFINAKEENNKLILTIKDNAGGISEKVISRVFEPYFTTKHKNNGTGIGLYMCQEIIKQYKNGSIKVSNENFYYKDVFYEGAMFSIILDLD